MRRRALVVGVVLALLASPLLAEDEARAVAKEEALAAVRLVLAQVREKAPKPGDDPAPWGMRPAAFSHAVFGGAYDQLADDRKPVVDAYARFALGAFLGEVAESLAVSRAEPVLTTTASEAAQAVTCTIRKRTFLFVVARTSPDAVSIVDAGVKEMLLGATVRTAWKAALDRKPEHVTSGELLVGFVHTLVAKMQDRAHKARAKDNIRTLVTLMLARRTQSVRGGWPPFGGKSFVLSVVAYGDLDARKPGDTAILFSPNVPESARAPAEAYKEVTVGALKEGRDWSKLLLTTYAGRRNDERDHLITPDQERIGAILVADLSFDDVVIAGYSNGVVKELTRADLGLGPDDPFTVGDEARSEELRNLSLR